MQIEGYNPVSEALEAGVTVEKLYVEKGNFSDRANRLIAVAKQKNVRVIFEEKTRLDAMSVTEKHQGVIAVATEFVYTPLEDILSQNKEKGKPLLLVILDGVEDPHNLGAVIRVADSAGADGVVIPKHRGTSVTDTVVKTSAGASSHVPVAKVTNINDAIRLLKDEGVFVLAADMDGASVYQTDLTGNIALIIGGEGAGVHALTKKLADGVISLPQLGKVNSLNASVAAGVLLYEAVRQRIK